MIIRKKTSTHKLSISSGFNNIIEKRYTPLGDQGRIVKSRKYKSNRIENIGLMYHDYKIYNITI